MRGEKNYLMSQKQLNRFHVLSMVIANKMTNSEAAESLSLSVRQIIRLKKGVFNQGPSFLIHKNKKLKPAHAFSDAFIQKIVSLKVSERYSDSNFLHFKDLLADNENISLSYSALYRILTKAGIKSHRKHRMLKKHHRRKRKAKEGLLVQIDASSHHWFKTDKTYALHGAIDDATGKILALYLAKNECRQGYFEIIRHIVSNYGIPSSLYTDRHTIFRSPIADKLSIEQQLAGQKAKDTQFGRAMKELGINIISARSPQAKGRIERLWETLQDRLTVEFQLAAVSSIEQANQFFISYIPKFNARFALKAADPLCAFRAVSENLSLDNILCVKESRILDNGLVFSFYNRHFQIAADSNNLIHPKSKVQVLVSPKFGVRAQYGENVYEVIPFIKAKKQGNVTSSNTKSKAYIPPDDHYFKYGSSSWSKLSFDDNDHDILKMLEKIFLTKYA